MSRHAIVDVLLYAGVAAQLVCCLGVALGADAFDRLHYAGAGSTVGPLLIMAAILVQDGFVAQGLETIAAVLVLFVASPVVVHAIARAAHRVYTDREDGG